MFKPASIKTAQIGLRRYSAQAAKAQGLASSLAQKGASAAKVGVYYSKVLGELLKYVWINERLSPPSAELVKKTFTVDAKNAFNAAIAASKNPQELAQRAKAFNRDDYVRFGAYAVQFLGIFALGEIIGRRHIYGYKDHKH